MTQLVFRYQGLVISINMCCYHLSQRVKGLIIIVLALISFSCREEQEEPDFFSNEEINNWIYEVMDDIYLWRQDISPNVDRSMIPEEFFESLLNRSEDRFSHISPSYAEFSRAMDGVTLEGGFEFTLVRDANPSFLNILIYYSKPGSPASRIGLKRGDMITKVFGERLNTVNYRRLLDMLSTDTEITYRSIDYDTETYNAEVTKLLSPVEYAENPNYLDTIYRLSNNHRVGYYIYNFFTREIDGLNYELEMDNIFRRFKNEEISHLIIDFRYNSGGEVRNSANLASLIGKVTNNDVFVQYEYNEEFKRRILEQDPDASFKNYFFDKEENINQLIEDNRVFFIVGRRTASASELVINSIKPFTDVVLIGETTVGKNVGSILKGDNRPGNDYALLPIVFRIENSLGESDYFRGFMPDHLMNEMEQSFKPLGSIEEPLLERALTLIQGDSVAPPSARVLSSTIQDFEGFESSIIERPIIQHRRLYK